MSPPTPPSPLDDPNTTSRAPMPDVPAKSNSSTPSDESPDRDTPAWEGSEPSDAVGLIDPRPEIPTPPGL